MENRIITVIGCGATGLATAAWYTLQGFQVVLCDTEEQFTDISLLEKQGGILVEGAFGGEKPIKVYRMTTDIAAAAKDVKQVIVCTSAKRQEEVSQIIAPVLRAGQAVLFSPGNMGSVYLRSLLKKVCKEEKNIISAELSGNLWACRMKRQGCVVVALPMSPQRVAAYPKKDVQKAVECFGNLFHAEPAENIAEAVLNSPNIITHLAGTLLNVAEIERKKESYALFEHGLSDTVIATFRLLEQERDTVLAAYGLQLYKKESSEVLMRKLMGEDTPEALRVFKSLDGPSSMQHRYIVEDASCGTALLVSMAREMGVLVPVTESLLTLASTINQTDYFKCGRTLYSMNLSKEELKREGD